MAKQKEILEMVELPDKVNAYVEGCIVTVEGPKGKVIRDFTSDNVSMAIEGKAIKVMSSKGTKNERKVIGSITAHLVNAMAGVTEGHSKKMRICSGHFPMSVAITGSELVVKNFMGEKTPRKIRLPQGIKVEIKGAELSIEGADKEAVGNAAGSIEKLTKRAKFDKRIFQDGIISITE